MHTSLHLLPYRCVGDVISLAYAKPFTVTRACATCRQTSTKPRPQLMGQLPIEKMTPGMVIERVSVNYARPVLLKLGRIHKPVLVKAYIGVFVSIIVKAVHLELISDLTSAAFIACLRHFTA